MKGKIMTKKDYIKFAKVFKKAFKENHLQKEYEGKNKNVTNNTDLIIGTMLDETIKIFEGDNKLFDEERFRQAISN